MMNDEQGGLDVSCVMLFCFTVAGSLFSCVDILCICFYCTSCAVLRAVTHTYPVHILLLHNAIHREACVKKNVYISMLHNEEDT